MKVICRNKLLCLHQHVVMTIFVLQQLFLAPRKTCSRSIGCCCYCTKEEEEEVRRASAAGQDGFPG
jgi:hypothetical protein